MTRSAVVEAKLEAAKSLLVYYFVQFAPRVNSAEVEGIVDNIFTAAVLAAREECQGNWASRAEP